MGSQRVGHDLSTELELDLYSWMRADRDFFSINDKTIGHTSLKWKLNSEQEYEMQEMTVKEENGNSIGKCKLPI